MFTAFRSIKLPAFTQRPADTATSTESDYLPCMFIFGLAVGFTLALATGSLLVAAGGCILGAIIGLSLAD